LKKNAFTLLVIASITLLGCQREEAPTTTTPPATLSANDAANTEGSHTSKAALAKKLTLPCKGTMPPIRDKSKLKKMLIDSGKITSDMTDDEANQIVSNYIKKKRAALDKCKH
jgi:bacillopeptidase F (M6 metalloprotease family)